MSSNETFLAEILDYLRLHPNEDISREKLMKETHISKSRLSEVLKKLRQENGYPIITPPRSGIVRLEITGEENIMSPVTYGDLKKWCIFFLLSRYEKLTLQKLVEKMTAFIDNSYFEDTDVSSHLPMTSQNQRTNNENNLCKVEENMYSISALRNDLYQLREEGLVTMVREKQTFYRISEKTPFYLVPISRNSMIDFCEEYDRFPTSNTNWATLKSSYLKMKKLTHYQQNEADSHAFGKVNSISEKQIKVLKKLRNIQYREHPIILKNHQGIENNFSVGLVYYSSETGVFYALGRYDLSGPIVARRIDCMEVVGVSNDKNFEYHKDEYYIRYRTLFLTAYSDDENPCKVKVLVQAEKLAGVRRRFENLKRLRENAVFRKIEDKPKDCIYDHVYEDTLIGLEDFAHFLRGFGYAVLAIEPKELRSRMEGSFDRILKNYEGETL